APLPDSAPAPSQPPPADARLPVPGCYLLNYTPTVSYFTFDGTLRIAAATGRLLASADLYQRDLAEPAPPDPAAGIPVFPIKSYRFYLRVKDISPADDGFSLAFEAYRFAADEVSSFDGSFTRWPKDGEYSALLAPVPAAEGYPAPDRCYAGDVKDSAGTTIGRLSMGFVSPYLRKATIEIDRVPESRPPLDNGGGITWRTVFDKVGWDITVLESDSDVEEPCGGVWNRAEAHAAMQCR